jgi:hydrogenase-4 membrane subunit HyfE
MEWANSPFVIPVAVFAMVLGIVIVANIYNYHVRKLKSEERMAAIAKGLPLPPDLDESSPAPNGRSAGSATTARGLRTGGIVCISVGVGLALFSFFLTWIVQEHDVLAVAAAGLIPLAVGVGLLIDYALRTKSAKTEGI